MANPIEIRNRFREPTRIANETNAGLWFDKYIGEQSREDPGSRQALIEEVSALPIPTAYRSYFDYWQKVLTSEYDAQTHRAQVKGRMIVGLGSESVLETSISLHRTYGVPYIPGSALKGLAANYARLRLGEDWKKGGKYYKIVFGNTDDAGYITFFDALYVPDPESPKKALYPDVITVHHQSYYQDANDAPADTDNPTPVPFLSATGTYLIALAAPDLHSPDKWLAITFKIVEEALKTFGVGAKTSSGYGRMEFVSPPANPVNPEVRKAEGYKHEIEVLRDVAGQIQGYYQKWAQLTSQEARLLLAKAIIEKVRKAGREKVTAEKAWYKELLGFLDQIDGTR
jgi:CRISPR-associated protein Cmr6